MMEKEGLDSMIEGEEKEIRKKISMMTIDCDYYFTSTHMCFGLC